MPLPVGRVYYLLSRISLPVAALLCHDPCVKVIRQPRMLLQ